MAKVQNTKIEGLTMQEVKKDEKVADTSRRFVLVREEYERDDASGTVSYSYFVEGKRGERKFRIMFVPKVATNRDADGNFKRENRYGMYTFLDFLFDVSDVVYVQQERYSYTTKDGEIKEATRYNAVGVDSFGTAASAEIELLGTADKKYYDALCSGFGGFEDANKIQIIGVHSLVAENVKASDLPFDDKQ